MTPLFEGVVREYRRMEPEGADTWNPLHRDRELDHRLVLYRSLCLALRAWPGDPATLRVLDVGCGNGRSSRMYLDFGILPGQVTGIDLRPAALDLARRLHPGIHYLAVEGDAFPIATASMNWVSLCTVVSSVGGAPARRRLAEEIGRVMVPGGRLFYFDRLRAHGFAGADPLEPAGLFPDLEPLQDARLRIHEGRGQTSSRGPGSDPGPATHCACLLRKPA